MTSLTLLSCAAALAAVPEVRLFAQQVQEFAVGRVRGGDDQAFAIEHQRYDQVAPRQALGHQHECGRDLRQHLPADTRLISPEARRQQIAIRQEHVQRRYRQH